ncbi:flagellar hook-length control protein FliK [Yoonia sp. I 8.24]|uniref:flagellar hook-length control protein FliK n=1 Tax=Yoonia sp. I 8.24 TaxID=1537229 RepID=UPI001EDE1487|nr:flagellar hook-length control protein FliK [Yoonia sp. I 8.24]MCG3269120.1 flagellar hook-length control protein FliK [Yoonia sp. I 8.24]
MIPVLQPEAANTIALTPTHGEPLAVANEALTFADLLNGLTAGEGGEDTEQAEVAVAPEAAEISLDQDDDISLGEILGAVAHPMPPNMGRGEGQQIEVKPAASSAPIENGPISRDGIAIKTPPNEAPETHERLVLERQLILSAEQSVTRRVKDIPQTVAGPQTDPQDTLKMVRDGRFDTQKTSPIEGLEAPKTVQGAGLDASKLTQIKPEQGQNSPVADQSRPVSRRQLQELAPASQNDLVSRAAHPAMTAPIVAAFQRETPTAYVPAVPTEIEPLFVAHADRAVQTQALVSQPSVSTQVDTARHVASQIAVAVTERAGRPTEISLNPEELGRVRMTMSVIDAAITLTVSAERQETTDLLRKHIETLSQEFRELGYNDISFSFGQRENASQSEQRETDGSYDQADDAEEVSVQQEIQIVGTSGLDIKL